MTIQQQYDPSNPLTSFNLSNSLPTSTALSSLGNNQFGNFTLNNNQLQPLPVNITGTALSSLGSQQSGLGGGLSSKLGGFSSLASGIASLGGLYNAFQANKLAKKQLSFQKDAFNANFLNSQQAYNTQYADKVRARYNTENRSTQEADAHIAANRLNQGGI